MLIPNTLLATGTKGGGPVYLVAAVDAPADVKLRADYLCDGSADEVQINAAIAALPTSTDSLLSVAGGGVVLSGGNFSIDSEILGQRDRFTLEGAGKGATIIKRSAAFSGSQMMRFDRLDMATASNRRNCLFITVGNFTLNGMWSGTGGTYGSVAGQQGATDGIVFRASRSKLHDFEVFGVNSWGVHVHGIEPSERGGGSGWACYGTILAGNFKVYENGRGGVWWDFYSGDAGMIGENAEVFENAGPGVFESDIVSQLCGMYIWANRDNGPDPVNYPGNGIIANSFGGRSIIGPNKIEQNRHGIRFTGGSSYVVVGNVINSNSHSTTGSSDAASGFGVDNSHWFAGESTTVNVQGALSGTGTGTFGVTSASPFPPHGGSFKVQIDSERMSVTISGTTMTISARGVDSTTAVSHSNGATVYLGKPIAANQCDDVIFDGSGGAPASVFLTSNILQSDVYPSDQSRYGLNFLSGDKIQARTNQYNGTWGSARINVTGVSGQLDFEALPIYKDNGTVGTSQTPDPFEGELQLYTLSASITMNAPSFARVGMKLRFLFTQNGTGGWTITWNGAYNVGVWVPRLDPNQTSEISFVYNGTNWICAEDSPKVLAGSTTWNPGSIATNGSETTTVTVTGARVGDPASAALTTVPAGATNGKWIVGANVTSSNTVTVVLLNTGAGTVDLGSGTLNVIVSRR